MVKGLKESTMEAEVWMTISMTCREGPRPSRVVVAPMSGQSSARLTFRTAEQARRFRKLHSGAFLAGRIDPPGLRPERKGCSSISRQESPRPPYGHLKRLKEVSALNLDKPKIVTRNVVGGTSIKSTIVNEPPEIASRAPELMEIARKGLSKRLSTVMEKSKSAASSTGGHAPRGPFAAGARNQEASYTENHLVVKNTGSPASTLPSPLKQSPKPVISVKNDVFLKGPTQSDLKVVLETIQRIAKPLETKSDTKKLDKELLIKQKEDCEVPWVPVIVEVAEEAGRVAKVRVFRVSHNKVQDFFHHDPQILVRAVIRYVQKYFPCRLAQRLALVTLHPAALGLLLAALAAPADTAALHTTFQGWHCLAWLASPALRFRGHRPRPELLAELLHQVRPCEPRGGDALATMARVLDALQVDWSAAALPTTLPEVAEHAQPPWLLLLHLTTLPLEVGVEGATMPAISTMGYRTSDRGSWFVAVAPEGREGRVAPATAASLGYTATTSGWALAGSPCLTERAALEGLLASLGEEQVVVVTPRRSEGLALLVAALEAHGLAEQLVGRGVGVGNVEEVLEAVGEKGALEKVDLSRAEEVPRAMLRLLEELLPSLAYRHLRHHLHPLLSPYTHSLLLASPLPTLSSCCHPLLLATPLVLPPGSQRPSTLTLPPSAIADTGHRLTLTGFLGLELYSEVQRLPSSLKVTVTVVNPGEGRVALGEGQRVGVAWREGTLAFPRLGDQASKARSPRARGGQEKVSKEATDLDTEETTSRTTEKDEEEEKERMDEKEVILSVGESRRAAIQREIAQLEEKLRQEDLKNKEDTSSKPKASLLDRYKAKKAIISQKRADVKVQNNVRGSKSGERKTEAQNEDVSAQGDPDSPEHRTRSITLLSDKNRNLTEKHISETELKGGEGSQCTGTDHDRDIIYVDDSAQMEDASFIGNPDSPESTRTKSITLQSGKNKSMSKPIDVPDDDDILEIETSDIAHEEVNEVNVEHSVLSGTQRKPEKEPDTSKGVPGDHEEKFMESLPLSKNLTGEGNHKTGQRRGIVLGGKSKAVHQPPVEVLDIEESDSEEIEPVASPKTSVCQKQPVVTLEDPIDIVEIDVDGPKRREQVQAKKRPQPNSSVRSVEVLDVEDDDDDDRIQILPVKRNKIHFIHGCAVADPEGLRQKIENYERRKREKRLKEAQVKSREPEQTQCEIEVLESCHQADGHVESSRQKDSPEALKSNPVSIDGSSEESMSEILEVAPSENSGTATCPMEEMKSSMAISEEQNNHEIDTNKQDLEPTGQPDNGTVIEQKMAESVISEMSIAGDDLETEPNTDAEDDKFLSDDESHENESRYGSKFNSEQDCEDYNIDIGSSSEEDAESLVCKPDLDAMVEFEAKKKIDLRKRKPASEDGDEEKGKCAKLCTSANSSGIGDSDLPKIENIEIEMTEQQSEEKRHTEPLTSDLPGGGLENVSIINVSSMAKDPIVKHVILEPRVNLLYVSEDDHCKGPNSGEVEQVTNSGLFENKSTLMEKAIHILNSKSLSQDEPVCFGPINKVKEGLCLKWVCDVCLKTDSRYARIKKHIRSHFHVNSYFCLKCETSFKYKHSLTRHARKCKAKPSLKVDEIEDIPDEDSYSETLENSISNMEVKEETTREEIMHGTVFVKQEVLQNVICYDSIEKAEATEDEIMEEEMEECCLSSDEQSKVEKTWQDQPGLKKDCHVTLENLPVMQDINYTRKIPLYNLFEDLEHGLFSSGTKSRVPNSRSHSGNLRIRKQRKFTGMGTSSVGMIVRKPSQKVNISFADDDEVCQIDSVHYKALAEKMTTELAIVKYVRPVSLGNKVDQEGTKPETEVASTTDENIENIDDQEDIKPETEDTINEDEAENYSEVLPITDEIQLLELETKPAWEPALDITKPILSQLRSQAKTLSPIRDDQKEDLCFEFPSLLSCPEFEPLLQTYLRMLDKPLDEFTDPQRQFADTVVTELVTAGVEKLPELMRMFQELVTDTTGADMQGWVAAVEERLPGLAQAGVLDPTFTTDLFVVVVLMHCLL